MSIVRQAYDYDVGLPARGIAATYADGHRLNRHTHSWGQLIYAASGVMRVATPEATWFTPPTRAIWVPGGTPHEIEMRGVVAMRTLYFSPAGDDPGLETCRAIEVAPLLRELILHIVRLGLLTEGDPVHGRLEALLVDLLAAAETAPLPLPQPTDPRARAFADRLMADPGGRASLARLARGSGASLRTLQRLFLLETGLALDTWRGRVRMQQALAALGSGASVTDAALDAGYQGPSAFIAAFKRTFGTTPSRYRARAG